MTVAFALLENIRSPMSIIRMPNGDLAYQPIGNMEDLVPESLVGILPPLYPEWLGGRTFAATHRIRFPYVVGEMARGIATPAMAVAAARAGFFGFFGSAGLPLPAIEAGIVFMQKEIGADHPGWGVNLIHSPQDPDQEMATVALILRCGLTRVSASAFMSLAPAVLLYAAKGLTRAADGRIVRRHYVFAKVSRPEVARHFLSPAPLAMLKTLVESGLLSAEEAELATQLPVAEDITVEADSGGHTDGRPLTVLLPVILALRDRLTAEHGYEVAPRIGAAGGLGTPTALAAAFAAGAAYVVTGSVNQCSQESGLSVDAQSMLATAGPADIAMAPAADMFELGVKVQVLQRGTFFAQRAQRLYEAYGRYNSIDDIPTIERQKLEQQVLGRAIDEIWAETQAYFKQHDPREVIRAEQEPRHRMALVFRWYLFMASQWARDGVSARRADYQIWCGPAMGAFNDWVRGSFLEPPDQRSVVQIGRNLLEGAAIVTRTHHLRLCGIVIPDNAFNFTPRPLG
jgi:trans-AT polyketide synthase/acyltransferase/oxidoreductase domain-containing protein